MLKYAVGKFKNMGRRNYSFDAEDTVQNAFVKITRYIDDIDFDRGEKSVKNYVFAILNNEICNFLKENEEFEEFDETFYSEEPYDFLEEVNIKESYNEILKAIETLDERYSHVLDLFYCKEKEVNEISEFMGLSPKTVYTRIARGRVYLLNSLRGVSVND
jgi:RNA polymerase sigma-70 factor (ECF subfamily)